MLELSRKVTFRATVAVFFGLNSCDFEAAGIKEDRFIASIVSYFKAWEFFLLRPSQNWDDPRSLSRHRDSVSGLQEHVRQLLFAAKPGTDRGTPSRKKKPLFIDLLHQTCKKETNPQELLEQSTLEMLLARTDTSSVTAYYALLGLAGNKDLQQELRSSLTEPSESETAAKTPTLLKSVVDETLRFKPVGPVILRETVRADPDFPFVPLDQGAAVLVHLAEMNLREEYWQDPKSFQPKRFLDPSASRNKTFFPFGEGPKGCIGMHLGRREVNTIVETVVSSYEMEIEGAETLTSLETHWDIANQPDKPALIRLRRLS